MSSREELIEGVMDQINSSFYDYRKWIMDEMRTVVSQWDEEQLKDFLGIARMKTVVVVDDNNYWLFYGDVESREEAIEQAKECDAFDPDTEIRVYEVKGELK